MPRSGGKSLWDLRIGGSRELVKNNRGGVLLLNSDVKQPLFKMNERSLKGQLPGHLSEKIRHQFGHFPFSVEKKILPLSQAMVTSASVICIILRMLLNLKEVQLKIVSASYIT